jgi:hypothetical protein
MLNMDVSQIVYNYVFVIGGIGVTFWMAFKLGVNNSIEEHMQELRQELSPIAEMDKRLDRIEYALYNDGKTGLINKVDCLVENQQIIKTEIEVIKAKTEGN